MDNEKTHEQYSITRVDIHEFINKMKKLMDNSGNNYIIVKALNSHNREVFFYNSFIGIEEFMSRHLDEDFSVYLKDYTLDNSRSYILVKKLSNNRHTCAFEVVEKGSIDN